MLKDTDIQVRLVGGTNQTGRVEVYFAGQWGTICHNGWDNNDAQVVCRQLGFTEGNHLPTSNAYFGRGSRYVAIMENVNCVGSESNIASCSINYWGSSCSHSYDAGVICNHGECTRLCMYSCMLMNKVNVVCMDYKI